MKITVYKKTSEAKMNLFTMENGREKHTNKSVFACLVISERRVTKLEKKCDEI